MPSTHASYGTVSRLDVGKDDRSNVVPLGKHVGSEIPLRGSDPSFAYGVDLGQRHLALGLSVPGCEMGAMPTAAAADTLRPVGRSKRVPGP